MSKFFIKFVDEDKPYIDENANNKVNNLLFNNQDKITKDITTAIEKNNSK